MAKSAFQMVGFGHQLHEVTYVTMLISLSFIWLSGIGSGLYSYRYLYFEPVFWGLQVKGLKVLMYKFYEM